MQTYSAQYNNLHIVIKAPDIGAALLIAAKRKPKGGELKQLKRVRKG